LTPLESPNGVRPEERNGTSRGEGMLKGRDFGPETRKITKEQDGDLSTPECTCGGGGSAKELKNGRHGGGDLS